MAIATMEKRQLALAVLVTGVATGLFSGFFGVGGGVIGVPLLVGLVGLTQHKAHGTSLATITVTATASAAVYALRGDVDWGLAAEVACGSVIGVALGARLMAKVPAHQLRRVFAVFMLVIGIYMIVR
jgi:uncharacterized membrane protein YfcA